MQLVETHLTLTTSVVEELLKAVSAKAKGLDEEALSHVSRLSSMETEADKVRRDIWLELSRGEIPPNERDDLLHLSKRVDQIADWARESGRILSVTPLSKAPPKLIENCIGMLERAKECAFAVRGCVKALTTNLNQAMELADTVERLEEEADELYIKARRFYATVTLDGMTVGEAILLAQLLDAIENISDWCENSVDQVRVIAVRML